MPARVLVVATEAVPPRLLRDAAPELREADEVLVVSPASRLTPLQWLANDEDEARGESAEIAAEEARAAGDATVETRVGDTDPIQATEDALATFAAEELVVVVPDADEASFLERSAVEEGFERFGLPVRYVVLHGGRDAD